MSRLLLDTNAYSAFMRGDSEVVEFVDRAEWIGMSPIVVGELRAGFHLGNRQSKNEADLQKFLANPAVSSLTLDFSVAQEFAVLFSVLRKRGRPIPTNDLWIAAHAIVTRSSVLTLDDHFRDLPGVSLESLTH